MRSLSFLLFGALALVATTLPARASSGESGEGEEETLDAVHHTADGNYLDFGPLGKLELPRLFVVRGADGGMGLDAFGSSTAAVASGRYHIEASDHGGEDAQHAVEAPEGAAPDASTQGTVGDPNSGEGSVHDEAGGSEPAQAAAPYDAHLVPTAGSVLVDLSITRHLVFVLLAATALLVLFVRMAGRYRRGIGRTSAPRGLLQNTLETLVIYIRDEIAKPNLGDKTAKYLPYLLTAFFFILVANLVGLVPFGATATSNIAVTIILALFTFVVTQMAGSRDYWGHIFNPPGIPFAVKLILVPVEILGLFTKPMALAIRLFANMTAGHLVILNFVGLIFILKGLYGPAIGWGASIPSLGMVVFVYALELLIAFIQAYVFTLLSALFIGMATAEHEHDHDHSQDHAPTAHDEALARSNGQHGPVHTEHERTVGTEAALSPF